jgi:hypothetical protein
VALSYQATVLANGPLMYLRFEETSGAACVDSSGFGHNGTAAGTFTRNVATGLAGFDIGITFGGTTSDFVSVPSSSALNITGNVTYEAVIKPASLPAAACIIDRGDDSGAAYGYSMVLKSTGQLVLTDSEFARTYASTTGGAISAGTLYHVVLTSTPGGGAYAAYINGVVNNTGVSAVALPGGVTSPLHIGIAVTRGTPVQPFPGLIDEVAIYNKILSASDVAAHWAARNTAASSGGSAILKPPPPGLVGKLPGGPKRNPKPHPKPGPNPPPVAPPPVVGPAERVDGELKRRDDE